MKSVSTKSHTNVIRAAESIVLDGISVLLIYIATPSPFSAMIASKFALLRSPIAKRALSAQPLSAQHCIIIILVAFARRAQRKFLLLNQQTLPLYQIRSV